MANSNGMKSALEHFEKQLEGELIRIGDDGYDDSRMLWNGLFNPQPVAIARCLSSGDVIRTVNFVRNNHVPFSIKSGGHDYAGHSVIDGGLVMDLSSMNAIDINIVGQTAVAGPGNTWQRFDGEAQKHGLATTGGTVSTVGIAGYTLGGGTGYLSRKLGLALDNLISADVVSADGELLHVSDEENPDLFWAIRGGSGNFGVVTSLEFRLHKIGPEIMAGQVVYPHSSAGEALHFYHKWMSKASDDLVCYAFFLNIPPIDAFPEEHHGSPALSLVLMHSGTAESASAELQPLLEFGDPILKAVQPMPYTAAQQMFDAGMVKGNRWYSKAHYLDSLPDKAIETILQFTQFIPGALSVAYLEPMGGAINRVSSTKTAFPHRSSAYGIHIFPGWIDPGMDDKPIAWAKEFFHAMAPYSNGGVYVNLLGHDEKERVKDAYGQNYSKLAKIKKRYDPENLFCNNHNINPDS